MAGDNKNTLSAIAPIDRFTTERPHFDFQKLRREGLTHIGELSGKIWTDHNLHDPGVTILEELCYALIDLGWRTSLPMEDLLAEPRGDSTGTDADRPRHENFFTPLEILSCNPTTVLDYRKLLLDVEGVRNAWLEPDETDSTPFLHLSKTETPELACLPEGDSYPKDSNPVVLNGLYNILIQKEVDADDAQVLRSVRETLAEHRNLCEDFKAITVLCPLEVGVCADVEIDVAADAAAVYEAIIKALRSYIAPELQYYTLKELLDKGRAIEDIFAGRPLLSSRSAGFVDTEELEALPLRDELLGSDLYRVVLDVEGVVAVRNLTFQTNGTIAGTTIQRVRVPPAFVAAFSLERTCIQLQTVQGVLFPDKERIHKRLQNGGKPQRGLEHLDFPVPEGRYRADLGDYYSIQHDFPRVYGIGKGGLSDEETLLRKVQARQLKGYLLFYDQLLANYLAQIANLRHLFSLREEAKRAPAERHTYFSQSLDSVPDRERLVQGYAARDLTDGSILAVPVADDAAFAQKLEELSTSTQTELLIADSCGSVPGTLPHFAEATESHLEVRVRQSVRDFDQGDYVLELFRDRNGYLFILRFKQVCELLLVSYRRYKNRDEAREAANFTVFLASRPEYYARRIQQVDLDGGGIAYQYNVVYNPEAYANYLQYLMENEELYLQRREAFLDHLLARFAAQFTDYALLRFGSAIRGNPERRQTIEDKSRLLSQIDDLSRNRGRAFDYLKPAWGTGNVSGYEKRVSLLAGMPEFKRRHLCKFEVVERFRIEVRDLNNNPWFSSIATYDSEKAFVAARKALIEQLGDPGSYDELRRRTRGFDPISVRRIFSRVAAGENIKPSRWVYALILRDSAGDVRRVSTKKDYAEESHAWRGLNKFLREVESELALELVATGPDSRLYIDNRELRFRIDPIITYKWYRYDAQGEQTAAAGSPCSSIADAVAEFVRTGGHQDLIVSEEDAALWSFAPDGGHPPLVSVHAFENELAAQRGWLRCKSDGQIKERYRQEPETGGRGTRITLTTEDGFELATAVISGKEAISPDEYIGLCQAGFGEDAAELDYPPLRSAYGWTLREQDDSVIMESAMFFREVNEALLGLLDALAATNNANNYFAAGTDYNPDYRILLRSPGGPFLATTPGFADEAERDKNLEVVRERMMGLHPPLEVREEPRRYRWKLWRALDGRAVLNSGQGKDFNLEGDAMADFERKIRRMWEEDPCSPAGQQVYAVELLKIEHKYRFVYCLNGPGGEPLPLLKSEEEFDADEAKEKYTEFVSALPRLVLETQQRPDRVKASGVSAAVLVGNRASVSGLLDYMRMQHDATNAEHARSKWIYRLLDQDHPIAKSKESYRTEAEAKAAKACICVYEPCSVDPKKDVVRVVFPELNPGKYHYALFLGAQVEGAGTEDPTLISYLGYATEEAAREASEKNWLRVIERAADPENYGSDRVISDTETYAESAGSDCDKVDLHLAVLPKGVDTDVAVARAKCYPVRFSYKKDEDGKLTSQVIGFHFQGYDSGRDESLWRSAEDFDTAGEALEAYRLFITVLSHPDSCRVVCDEGRYRIHLVEVLAESREFDTAAEAWDDPLVETKDECGRPYCRSQGVRLFAERATSEAAFVPVRDGDCYRFDVVGDGYTLARHSCDHHSRDERDSAMKALHGWARSLEFDKSRILTDENMFLQFHLGQGYFLQSPKRLPELRESDAQKIVEKIVDEWVWLASSSRNYRRDPDDAKWMLVNPLESDVVIASVECEKKSGAVDFDAFLELVRAYPIFKKNDGYCFRLYYPKNGAQLDEELKICGCHDADDGKQQAALSFCGQIYVYESTKCYLCRTTAEKAFRRFLDLLDDLDSYHPEEETGLGTFSFSIVDREQVLASHPYCHPDRESAMRAEKRALACVRDEGMHLVEHILLRPQTSEHCDCLLPVSPDHPCTLKWQEDLDPDDPCAEESYPPLTYVPGADPYSFWATVVLPGWIERFNNGEKRHFFRQMLYREVPAMVGLNIVWLGPREMCKFEEVLKIWLRSLRCPPVACDGESDPFCDMVNLIGGLCNELPCPDPELASAECECLPKEEEGWDDACIEASESLFWLECRSGNQQEDKPPAVTVDKVDRTAVRKEGTKRRKGYEKNFRNIDYAPIKKAKSYGQAQHFLTNAPSLPAFKLLTEQIVKDMSRKGKKRSEAFAIMFSNVFWYLIDHLLQEDPTEVAPDVKTMLPPLLQAMKKKGMGLEDLAVGWEGEALGELLGTATTKAVHEYLTLIKKG